METEMKDVRIKLPEAEFLYLKALAISKGWQVDTEAYNGMMPVSADVKELTGIASSISQEQIKSDPRLAYLMQR